MNAVRFVLFIYMYLTQCIRTLCVDWISFHPLVFKHTSWNDQKICCFSVLRDLYCKRTKKKIILMCYWCGLTFYHKGIILVCFCVLFVYYTRWLDVTMLLKNYYWFLELFIYLGFDFSSFCLPWRIRSCSVLCIMYVYFYNLTSLFFEVFCFVLHMW